MKKSLIFFLLVALTFNFAGAKGKLNTRDVKRHAYLLNKVKKERSYDVLMLGDSITHLLDAPEQLNPRWVKQSGKNNDYLKQQLDGKKILVAGISGETTTQLLSRLENGLAKAKSKYTVIMIGTNDTRSPLNEKQVAGNIEEIIKLVNRKNSKTKILLYAIFPRGSTPAKDPKNMKNIKVNKILATFPKKFKNVEFIDINEEFLDEKGNMSRTIMYDLLHPALEGYKIWIKSIKSKIK